ncbi:aspartyl/asparaginyl beta-hydroxylase domain-containing protein [Citromicrobium sp. JLT1363]|uniref:aspartyl/asparaginyl beta-hydroxylase domain-containing protein n=1 Tax=Citromicrobium sp. JLT1363 TaxID=517722 RepID=UPI000491376C|nr:aspartyl/asparaginyl beta-hydroxylase domain-containing protein [Citromicrobium sp. JLT1363]
MRPIVRKPDFIRPLGKVDIDPLMSLVPRLSDRVWEKADGAKENTYAVFHHTQHIVFRFIHRNRDPDDYYDTRAWPLWAPVVEPIMHKAVAEYGFRSPIFPKAMLARLKAGHYIDLHSDGTGAPPRCHKIHVPLITNPDAIFHIGEQSFHLPAGEAVEVNNMKKHGAENAGTQDRIHLIFEVFEGARPDA